MGVYSQVWQTKGYVDEEHNSIDWTGFVIFTSQEQQIGKC